MNKKFSTIDLFCGAGGLSLGFKKAGFEILVGIDNDTSALETYKNNFKNAQSILCDLSKLDKKHITNFGHVDVLLGGPPCQGFSIAGKRDSEDPRNLLVISYLEIMKELMPRVAVIENVPNIMSIGKGAFMETIQNGLGALGYNVTICKLNSADFGVPQTRKRVFFIATRDFIFDINDLMLSKTDTWITTEQALSDLPLLEESLGEYEQNYSTIPMNSYQELMRKYSNTIINHQAVDHKPKTKEIISMVPDGCNYKSLPDDLQNTRKVNIAWTRMNSQKPCFTIDAGHNHHFHYKANRVPTVRECARIQSFPDDFHFLGKRTSQYRQVGNAVPPILSEVIANSILKQILEN